MVGPRLMEFKMTRLLAAALMLSVLTAPVLADSTSTPAAKATEITAVITAFDAEARSVTLADGRTYMLGAGLSSEGFIVGDKVMLTINRADDTVASVDEAE
jgi:Cu/Ag efflux protein CusF